MGVRHSLAASTNLINVQPLGRWTVLHQAAHAGSSDVVTFLLEQGADVTLKTSDGRTPFEVASTEAVRTLLRAAEAARSSPAIEKKAAESGVAASGADAAIDCAGAISAVAGSSTDAAKEVAGSSPDAAKEASISVWQVQPEALPGKWVDMGKERQALLCDAKVAGIPKAVFREGGRSYIVDLEALTQTDFATGNVCLIRLQKLSSEASKPVDAGSSAKEATCTAVIGPGVKSDGKEPAPGETVDVPGSGAKPYTV